MEALYRPAVIRRLLTEYGLRPSKGLGQNFLADGNTVQRITEIADVGPGDRIVEIGPGLGALTEGLLDRGAYVVAIEKDAGLVRVLRDLFKDHPRFLLLHADALDVDLAALFPGEWPADTPRKVVANLPYYITSQLLIHILESTPPFERAVVMIQREVADRLVAAPGSKAYGALTVGVAFRAEVQLAARVPPTVFFPPPTVASEVVLLKPRPFPFDVGDPERFFRVVRAAFGKRRKTLANALKELGLGADEVALALSESGIDGNRRGETLTLAEFASLSGALSRR